LTLPRRQEPAAPPAQPPAATPANDELKPVSTKTPPEDLQDIDGADKPVRAVLYPMFDKLPRGGKCPVAVQLTVANDWHINANPASPDNLIPTEIKLTSPHKVRMTRVKYPDHHEFRPPGTSDVLHVYDGKVIIYVLLETDPEESATEAELNFEIRYQACSGETCLPPDRMRLSTRLKTASPDSEIRRINQSLFPAPAKQQPLSPAPPQ
ncbi:MAG: protein-disulfide reductase DsbD domain-containing protein, partial [Planctomycetaceae bacterium]